MKCLNATFRERRTVHMVASITCFNYASFVFVYSPSEMVYCFSKALRNMNTSRVMRSCNIYTNVSVCHATHLTPIKRFRAYIPLHHHTLAGAPARQRTCLSTVMKNGMDEQKSTRMMPSIKIRPPPSAGLWFTAIFFSLAHYVARI